MPNKKVNATTLTWLLLNNDGHLYNKLPSASSLGGALLKRYVVV